MNLNTESMLKRVTKVLGLIVLTFLLIMLINTLMHSSKQIKETWKGEAEKSPEAFKRLATALMFKTVSNEHNDSINKKEFVRLFEFMKSNFPKCFSEAEIVQFHNGAFLMKFKGKNEKALPALFLAHLDVVPVDSLDLKKWKYAPFAGTIANDTLYGRGSLDDKIIAMAMLESMEASFLQNKFPNRPIYFAFGDDEEIGGKNGAAAIAKYLRVQKIYAEFIMDEGLGVTENIVPGIDKPAAIIGLSEKGFCSIKLAVTASGGHSSMPDGKTATGILTEALFKLENSNTKQQFSEPMKLFLETGAPEMSFPYRFLFSNLWATGPLVKMVMSGNPKTAASIQTIKSTTMMHAGVQDNVVPNEAWAIVNFRILPGESSKSVMEFVGKTINNAQVQLSFVGDITEPGATSPISTFGYTAIQKAIAETFNNTVTLPGQVLAGTDCKHYYGVSNNIYRFVPLRLNNQNISGIHGINERISANNYYECMRFYKNLFGVI